MFPAERIQQQRAHQPYSIKLPAGWDAPLPWCRRCQCSVSSCEWTRYGDTWGFSVECHGATMDGVVTAPSMGNVTRLEVFAYDDPRMEEGPWWWVRANGSQVQESRSYLATCVGSALFGGPFGRLVRLICGGSPQWRR